LDAPGTEARKLPLVFSGRLSVRVRLTVRVALDLDLGVHQPGFRAFMVPGEASAYWTVYDGAL
jgi:hypothetical protein